MGQTPDFIKRHKPITMKQKSFLNIVLITSIFITSLIIVSCNCKQKANPVAANIKMYTNTWDQIINKGNLGLFNDSIFTSNLVMHEGAMDVAGIDSARANYANYLTGFSDINFTIKDVFGQGDKIVKYWNFKGKHTGMFFGIPATGKNVSIDGVTLVRMENGTIAEERDFIDNLDFNTQMGLTPEPAK